MASVLAHNCKGSSVVWPFSQSWRLGPQGGRGQPCEQREDFRVEGVEGFVYFVISCLGCLRPEIAPFTFWNPWLEETLRVICFAQRFFHVLLGKQSKTRKCLRFVLAWPDSTDLRVDFLAWAWVSATPWNANFIFIKWSLIEHKCQIRFSF